MNPDEKIYHGWLGQIEKSKDDCLVLCGLPMMAYSDPDTQIFYLPHRTNDKFFFWNNDSFKSEILFSNELPDRAP